MTSTHLITQAVVAGLQSQIDTVTNQLNTANSDLASAIQGLINSLNTAYDTVRTNLEAHILEDYSTVHGGATSAQVNYLDSAANIVGDYVVGINIGGTQLWLPASSAQAGVCHSQCHSACNCTCTPYGSPMVMADGSVRGVQTLKVGDSIMGFHEGYYVETKVEAVHRRDARVLRYHLDNGTYVDSTEDHRWYIDGEYKPAHPGARLLRFKRPHIGFQLEHDVVMVERTEDLGFVAVYSVTTGTGNYLNQGHLSANCEFW